jgi:hypothetical protein
MFANWLDQEINSGATAIAFAIINQQLRTLQVKRGCGPPQSVNSVAWLSEEEVST